MTRGRPRDDVSATTVSLLLLLSAAAVSSADNVTVFRCCGRGEMLDPTDVHGPCALLPASLPQDFVPVIFDVISNQFLNPNEPPPAYWNLVHERPPCKPAAFLPASTPQDPPRFVSFLNGTLLAQHWPKNLMVDPGLFCLDRAGALLCLPDEPNKTKKCCGPSAVYSEANGGCEFSGRHDAADLPEDITSGFPRCEDDVYILSGRINESHWPVSGAWPAGGQLRTADGVTLQPREYCLERVLEQTQEPRTWTVFTCAPRHGVDHVTKSYREDIRFTLYPLGLLLSVFFLAITLVASCMLPSTYHVLHWRCQVNHVGCLLVGDLFLAFVQLSGDSLRGPLCVFTAIVMHFVFLAAFFWLNTMCFNIWWTFRDLRPANLDKGQEACRLRLYQLYAWGVPLVIATLAAVLDRIPPDQYMSLIRPKFGEHRCWFYGDAEVLSYFYGPIGILLMMNLTLFAATARELTCGLWRTEVVKSTSERATLGRVCLKLVIVMGITWVVDVLSWVIGGPDYVWYLTDLMNALQGVLIFIVVGCQPQVWMAVRRMWCLRTDNPSDGGNARSSTSNANPSTVNESTLSKPVETLC
ncbi:probable G-protein coupled receptor Mth-like 1 [Metopolophium dirhodum]|uniref:probable G-protein coupled receptor Mth-like 1 n=1 Tax=Metopolophium dirhodum TaxID=44670 RepID=UPI00299017FB|nr:probable G-protein coupled receptor Mth-like 1 [Metopolophium dirhodum]